MPCALALAVPAVLRRRAAFAKGIIVKAADGLERPAEVDTVVFDKTARWTRGEPSLKNGSDIDDVTLDGAAALAAAEAVILAQSPSPRPRASLALNVSPKNGVIEVPGSGLSLTEGQTLFGPAHEQAVFFPPFPLVMGLLLMMKKNFHAS